MKKNLILLLLTIMVSCVNARSITPQVITHYAAIDSALENVSITLENGVYVVSAVEKVAGASAEQLFKKAKEWVYSTYKNPQAVIKAESKPTQLIFEGQLSDNMNGRMEFKLKNGRYKWTMTNLTMNIHQSLYPIEGLPAYRTHNERADQMIVLNIFDFIMDFRKGLKSKKDDNW